MTSNGSDEILKSLASWFRKNNLKKEAHTILKLCRFYKYAVSEEEVASLKRWLDDHHSELSFEDLFDEKLRVLIPFNSEEQEKINQIVSFLKEGGWMPAGNANFFNTNKVKQRMRKLDTGEEYEKEVEVADLKVSKVERRVIPKGPRKGEEVASKVNMTISKVLSSPKYKAPDWMSEWWAKNQSDYAKNYNWNQLEVAFKNDKVRTEHSVVISRDPIDVLRMSDHKNISSCHSEGESYFRCAVSESRGNGLVAYLVKTSDIDRLTKPSDDSSSVNFNDLDSQEIFEDRDRGVKGIVPISRLRLRKYVNIHYGYEFAVPEHRSYGPSMPGFKGVVRRWAWNNQKDLFDEFGIPKMYHLIMHGGSYRDTDDGEILNAFFEEGGLETDLKGNAVNETTEEGDLYDLWETQIDEINDRASLDLNHVNFFATIDDVGHEEPLVGAEASIECEIFLSGWGDIDIDLEFATTDSGFKAIPIGHGYSSERRDFESLLEHDEYGDIAGLYVSEREKILHFEISFRCDDCRNPDDINHFFELIKTDVDGTYGEYIEEVRKKLIEEGYIGKLEYDRVIERLNSDEIKNFVVLGGDEDDYEGEVVITSGFNPLLNLTIPPVFFSKSSGYDGSYAFIGSIFNAKKIGPNIYSLIDEPLIISNTLDEIAKEAEKQLSFSFFKEDLNIDYHEAVKDLKITFKYLQQKVEDLRIEVFLNIKQDDEHLLFLEKFIKILDKDVLLISKYIAESMEYKLKVATKKQDEKLREFLSGNTAMPIIQNLKNSSNRNIIGLATWIEENWNNFSSAEKETAYFHYLKPLQSGGNYTDHNGLRTPRHWNSYMQRRGDTDISYRWMGPSIGDVMREVNFRYDTEDDSAEEEDSEVSSGGDE